MNSFWRERIAQLASLGETHARIGIGPIYVLVLAALVVVAIPTMRRLPVLAEPAVETNPKIGPRPHRAPERAVPAEAKLARKLDDLIAVNFSDVLLRETLEYVDALQNLKLQYDMVAIRKARVAMDQPITLNLKVFPLYALLKLLLEPVQLDWIIRDGAIVITTRAVAEAHLSDWSYDVNDLVATGIPAKDLASAVATMVAPQSWASSGGAGSVGATDNSLVVRQAAPVHRELQRLLRGIRRTLIETEAARRTHENRLVTKQYDVSDFVDPLQSPQQFTEFITGQVCLTTWDRSGGQGTIDLNQGTLQVTNAVWVQEHLTCLFERVQEFGLQHGRNGSTFNFQSALDRAMLDGWENLDTPLDQIVTIRFDSLPLADAMSLLSRSLGVYCVVPRDASGKYTEFPRNVVTKTFVSMPLRSVLDQLLSPFKLDWYVGEYPVVTVARPEEAAARRDLKVFRVVELTKLGHSAEQSIKGITESIEPMSWKAAGGTATIRALPGLLIVGHNRRVHALIQDFLDGKAK